MTRRTFLRYSKGQLPDTKLIEQYLYQWPAELLYAHAQTLPRLTAHDLFANERALELEIGCGSADFLCSLAASRPATNFVGVDISGLALYKAIAAANELALANIKFINADFHYLLPLLCPNSLHAVYLHFPDPNRKAGFRRRRIFNKTFLDAMTLALTDEGHLSVMTDVHDFFLQMLYLVEQDQRFVKVHPQRYIVGFEPAVKSRFQRIWEGYGESVFRFEVRKNLALLLAQP